MSKKEAKEETSKTQLPSQADSINSDEIGTFESLKEYFFSFFSEDLELCNECDQTYDGLSITNKYGVYGENGEKQIYEARYTFQSPVNPYWILMYPLSVLATNRALDTVISRKVWSRRFMPLDMRDIFSLGRFKAVYAGIIPGVFMFMMDSALLYRQEYISPDNGELDGGKEGFSADV